MDEGRNIDNNNVQWSLELYILHTCTLFYLIMFVWQQELHYWCPLKKSFILKKINIMDDTGGVYIHTYNIIYKCCMC